MPHTHSTIETIFYYVGLVLYGNMGAIAHGSGVVALFVLYGMALRSPDHSWIKSRWYLLLLVASFSLITLNDLFGNVVAFKLFSKVVSVPLLILLSLTVIRYFWEKRTKPSIK